MNIDLMQQKALKMRQTVLKTAWHANGGHIAPSLSCIEIIEALYLGDGEGILKYNPQMPDWTERDYFILSKGHGGLALYVALAMAGYFEEKQLLEFCSLGGMLGSLAAKGIPGVEVTGGSLGHGLSYAVGIAEACKMDKQENHIYVLLGDGECEEGSVWEALMSASHLSLDNMTIIIDNNGLQAMDSVINTMSINNYCEKAKSFGMDAIEIDGHDFSQVSKALKRRTSSKPVLIVANTIKGKGISFMENVPIWHYRIPNDEEIKVACRDLKMNLEDLGGKKDSFRVTI